MEEVKKHWLNNRISINMVILLQVTFVGKKNSVILILFIFFSVFQRHKLASWDGKLENLKYCSSNGMRYVILERK